jgi:hypothetical protein
MGFLSRNQQLQQKYSITEEIYEKILIAQKNVCAICGNHQRYKRLAVDHSHKTGQVRGLLCENCNRGLGRFFDSTFRLRNAANYLERAEKAWNEVMKCQQAAQLEKSKILLGNISVGHSFPPANSTKP